MANDKSNSSGRRREGKKIPIATQTSSTTPSSDNGAVTIGSVSNGMVKVSATPGLKKVNDLRSGQGPSKNMAQAQSVIRTQPKIYSPMYEMSNLMLPRDQKTINAWNRIFYETNPIVRNSINLHASYPISKFKLTCKDYKIRRFFEDMFEDINMIGVLQGMALEYWKLGEVFPYAELDENNGTWSHIFCHNPDFIRVRANMLTREPIISLVADDNLRSLVNSTNPADNKLRAQLPAEVIHYVQRGEDIPLPNFNVSHLKMLSSDYDIRGTSIITSCYKDLMMYDKIREAKFAQADNMINPLTLIKLGDPNGTWKPNDEDIRSFQQAFEEAQYDLDFKLITHGAVSVEKIGASGATMEVGQDIELIMKNIRTGLFVPEAVSDGDGPNYACFDNYTESLTNFGFKRWDEIVEIDESREGNQAIGLKDPNIKIGCFNPNTEELEYYTPTECHVYDYDSNIDGEMIKFETKKLDILVTPNHRMWVDNRKSNKGWHNNWHFERADEVKSRVRKFRSQLNWSGYLPEDKKVLSFGNSSIPLVDYLEFVGYYISEGHTTYSGMSNKTDCRQIVITQQQYRKGIAQDGYKIIDTLMSRLPFNVWKSFDSAIDSSNKTTINDIVEIGYKQFGLSNKILADHLALDFGRGSANKKVPLWIKNLPTQYLQILLDALLLGDGHISTSNDHGRQGKNGVNQYQYFSTSTQLADDVYEMVYKTGKVPTLRIEKRSEKNSNHKDMYWVEWSDSTIGHFPSLDTRSKKFPEGAITKIPYKGKVYCFSVPPHELFVTRRNGKVTIQGNTATVGLEVLRTRYERFRNHMSVWMKKKIIEPICKIQDFYEYVGGTKRLIVPEICWDRIHLRDTDSYLGHITSMMDTENKPEVGRVSERSVYEILDIDYDEEQRNLKEQAREKIVRAKEIEIMGQMPLEILRTLDLDKPILPTPEMEEEPIPGEGEEGDSGGISLDMGSGGGGGGMPSLPGGDDMGSGDDLGGGGDALPGDAGGMPEPPTPTS